MDGVCHLEFTPSAPFALLDVGEPVFLATPLATRGLSSPWERPRFFLVSDGPFGVKVFVKEFPETR
jgi:hypothetical protein